jgi:hypothetical protein
MSVKAYLPSVLSLFHKERFEPVSCCMEHSKKPAQTVPYGIDSGH